MNNFMHRVTFEVEQQDDESDELTSQQSFEELKCSEHTPVLG